MRSWEAAAAGYAAYHRTAGNRLCHAAGWAFQFVGHAVFEKRRAAFQDDLLHLLVGPAWLLSKALGLGR